MGHRPNLNKECKTMTLKEIVKIMNMAQLDVCSKNINQLHGRKDVNMFDLDNDPIVRKYGDHEVEEITNIAFLGVTVWIK